MEKSRTKKYTFRAGLILALLWLLIASAMFGAIAATSGSGDHDKFEWTWKTDNTGSSAAGDVSKEGSAEGKLVLQISATSSVDKRKTDSCGKVSGSDAESTTTTVTVVNSSESTLRIDSIVAESGCTVSDISEGAMLADGNSFTASVTATTTSGSKKTETAKHKITITYSIVENVEVVFCGADNASYTRGETTLDSISKTVTEKYLPKETITLPKAPTVTTGFFYGWRLSHDGSLHAEEEEIEVSESTSVYPVVADAGLVSPFTVGEGSYRFWSDAVCAAVKNKQTIILNQTYTLPATMEANGVHPSIGSKYVTLKDEKVQYIVPSGVVFLIPYNDANTLCKEDPTYIETADYVQPTPYRTLTLANNAKIAVQGSMSLSGQMCSRQPAYGNGAPYGKISIVEMESGSSIDVSSGGNLYCWGIIAGAGSVTMNSGATLYQNFQVTDFRGGSASSDMKGNDQKVFPMSQYYFQNVEVPLTIESGAKMKVTTLMNMSMVGLQHPSITLFGDAGEGLFRLSSGSVTLDYQESTDRMNITVNGTVSIASVTLSFKANMIAAVSLNSADYVMPLNPNLSIYVKDGSTVTVTEDLALLPSCEVVIEQGGKVSLTNNAKLYVYDIDQWGPYVMQADKMRPVKWSYANGATAKRTADGLEDALVLVNGEVDATAGYIYTTTSGANIYSTGNGVIKLRPGTDTKTYQAKYASEKISYSDIAITPAKLKNADGKYVSTQNDIQGVVEYKYVNGVWQGVLKVYKDSTVSDENSGVMIQYRTESYLWLNASCYVKFLKDKDGALLADGVLSVTSGGVTNTYDLAKQTFTTNDGVQIVMSGDAVYIVKKIVAKEIPDEIKFTISYVDAEANVTFVSEVVTADFKTDMAGDPVGDAYIQYGTAAKDYFDGDTTLSSGSVPENPVKNGATVTTTGAPVAWNGATLETTGANIYFDEALRLGISYDLSTIPSGYKIAQIGLLVGDYGIENLILDNASKAYLMYDLLNGKTVDGVVINNDALSGASSDNRPWDKDGNVINVTPEAWQEPDNLTAGTIIFDLAAQDYKTMFAIRPVIVLEKEGSYVCVYGRQIGYGLEAYINGVYAEASDEYKYLLEMTWALAGAASPVTGG